MSKTTFENKSLAGIDIAGLSIDDLKAIVGTILRRKIHGVAFSPYGDELKPGMQITGDHIRERLSIVQPYVNWVRTFSCTEGNELIPQIAQELGLKTMVGVWLGEDREKNELELNSAIEVARSGYANLLGIILIAPGKGRQMLQWVTWTPTSISSITRE
jgi:hypothetical protein